MPRVRGVIRMEYNVRVEQLSSRPLAVVRRRASLPQLAKVVPDACGTVWNVVRAQKLMGAGRHVALYWDDVINLEVGVELDTRSEEHTSELQSRSDIVCRLLLEIKKLDALGTTRQVVTIVTLI